MKISCGLSQVEFVDGQACGSDGWHSDATARLLDEASVIKMTSLSATHGRCASNKAALIEFHVRSLEAVCQLMK